MDLPTGDHKDRLHKALEAARKAGNPTLCQSILCALEGRPRTVSECAKNFDCLIIPEDLFPNEKNNWQ